MYNNSTNVSNASNFSITANGVIANNYISSNSILTAHDTTVDNILLYPGTQITTPMNINGYKTLNVYVNYGVPVKVLKSHLSVNLNGIVNTIPSFINNAINLQTNKNVGITISLSSNISERIDFLVSSNTNVTASVNSLNKNLSSTYTNENGKASLNLLLGKSLVLATDITYIYNSGLSMGYNQNYFLWNLSFGKKLFKQKLGDIRISVFDILHENNNIQHITSPLYIQDLRYNTLQRYCMLTFMYKIRSFKNPNKGYEVPQRAGQ